MDRRSFLRLASVAGLGVAGGVSLGACKPEPRRGLLMGIGNESDFAAVAAQRVSWVRLGVQWDWTQPDARGVPTNWRRLDSEVRGAHAAGLKLLATVQGVPDRYARHNGVGARDQHDYPKDAAAVALFADYALGCARRGVDAIEIGNEWNNPPYFILDLDPAWAAFVTIETAKRIKAAYPHVPVITGGLAPASSTRDGGLRNPANFLSAMQRARPDLASHVDGVGWHPYTSWYDPRLPLSTARWNTLMQVEEVPLPLRGRAFWFTEHGVSTGDVGGDEARQAYLEGLFYAACDTLRSRGIRFGPMFHYRLFDKAADGPKWGGYGLYREDRSEKPNAVVLHHEAGRHGNTG